MKLEERIKQTDEFMAMSYREGLTILEDRGVNVTKDDYKIIQELDKGHTLVIATETLESPQEDGDGNKYRRELVIRRIFEGEEPRTPSNNVVVLKLDQGRKYDLSAYKEMLEKQEIKQEVTDEDGNKRTVKLDVINQYEDRLPILE